MTYFVIIINLVIQLITTLMVVKTIIIHLINNVNGSKNVNFLINTK